MGWSGVGGADWQLPRAQPGIVAYAGTGFSDGNDVGACDPNGTAVPSSNALCVAPSGAGAPLGPFTLARKLEQAARLTAALPVGGK